MSSISDTVTLESLAVNLIKYRAQCPELFSVAIPTGYLYILQNDLEKFTDYLEQYQRRLGDEKFIYLLTQGLIYDRQPMGIVDACVTCARAKMCLEIIRYLPDYQFNLRKVNEVTNSNHCRFLAKKFDITLVRKDPLIFQCRMLSYPIQATFCSKTRYNIILSLRYNSDYRLVSECLLFLLRTNSRFYRLTADEKSFLFDRSRRNELNLLKEIGENLPLDSLVGIVINILYQQTELIFTMHR